ncbi:FAD:protein FMN transferase, partial [Klebsiella pneumoniae]|uniref:FAD:protein FMN transferase n=1 Tax=Klebsiella pneumoniae TaxID=573 RepID=UPI003853078F
GNYKRGYLIQGKWYSHIVDPRTGQPVEEIIAATVIAPKATDAGALATAFNVLSVEESKQLALQYPDAAYLIITKNGEQIKS